MPISPDYLIKIAIADDHKIFRDGIKMALSGKDNLKMLWEAEDGKDMMHKIAIKKPEVLLMDIRMPKMNGYEATRQIRLFNKSVVIIAQTALALTGDREKAIEAGCNDYIAKPYNQDWMIELIEKHFNTS